VGTLWPWWLLRAALPNHSQLHSSGLAVVLRKVSPGISLSHHAGVPVTEASGLCVAPRVLHHGSLCGAESHPVLETSVICGHLICLHVPVGVSGLLGQTRAQSQPHLWVYLTFRSLCDLVLPVGISKPCDSEQTRLVTTQHLTFLLYKDPVPMPHQGGTPP
jgi:hypothetical protein